MAVTHVHTLADNRNTPPVSLVISDTVENKDIQRNKQELRVCTEM